MIKATIIAKTNNPATLTEKPAKEKLMLHILTNKLANSLNIKPMSTIITLSQTYK